jgi:Uncharacterized protein family UPF0016
MQAFLISFGIIFVAELGDRSQLMAMTFAARSPPSRGDRARPRRYLDRFDAWHRRRPPLMEETPQRLIRRPNRGSCEEGTFGPPDAHPLRPTLRWRAP